MHAIIAGCGRVGAMLAARLGEGGHDVVVVDRDARSFRRLDPGFAGRTLHGIVFDRETLEEAGARQADAFIAVTNGDNSNVVAARTARDRFGVAHVVARIYDPDRAAIYERLGIVTVASARWTVDEALRALLPEGERFDGALGAGAGEVVMVTWEIPAGVQGLAADRLNEPGRWLVAGITRQGRTSVPIAGALLSGGDRIHVAVERDHIDGARQRVRALAQDAA